MMKSSDISGLLDTQEDVSQIFMRPVVMCHELFQNREMIGMPVYIQSELEIS